MRLIWIEFTAVWDYHFVEASQENRIDSAGDHVTQKRRSNCTVDHRTVTETTLHLGPNLVHFVSTTMIETSRFGRRRKHCNYANHCCYIWIYAGLLSISDIKNINNYYLCSLFFYYFLLKYAGFRLLYIFK